MAPESGTPLASPAGRGIVLAAVLGSSVALLDGTVVNVALPHIGTSLGSKMDGLQWIVNGYTLMLAALVLTGGALGDRFGRRRLFLIGVIWFGLASVLCGLSTNIGMLIAARFAQGIGAGLLTPGSLAIIQSSIRRDDRAKAIGAWSGMGGVVAAAGPFLGGWLVDALSWPWIFFLNVPLVAVSILATLRWVPETRDETATGHFGITGNILGALFLGGITFALVQSAHPVPAIVAGVLGLGCGIGFLVVERRSATPVLPPYMFASRQFTAINAVTFCVYAGLGGVLFFLVMQLQVVSGYSALQAGITMLPFTLLMLAFSAKSGALGERLGPRLPLAVGSGLAAVGVLLLAGIGPDASYFTRVLPGVLVLSVGMTIVVAPLTAGVLAAADSAHAGVASGINNAVARAASLVAVAALPLVAGITGDSYEDAEAFAPGYRIAIIICACLFLIGAVVAAVLVSSHQPEPPARRPVCRVQCPYAAPQLEPAPQETGRSRNP